MFNIWDKLGAGFTGLSGTLFFVAFMFSGNEVVANNLCIACLGCAAIAVALCTISVISRM